MAVLLGVGAAVGVAVGVVPPACFTHRVALLQVAGVLHTLGLLAHSPVTTVRWKVCPGRRRWRYSCTWVHSAVSRHASPVLQSPSLLQSDTTQAGPAWPDTPCEPGGHSDGGGRTKSANAALLQNSAMAAQQTPATRFPMSSFYTGARRAANLSARSHRTGAQVQPMAVVGGHFLQSCTCTEPAPLAALTRTVSGMAMGTGFLKQLGAGPMIATDPLV